jgi:hypothetical protein
VTQVALSHSYLFSLSGSRDTTVKVYDNEMGEIVAEFTVKKMMIDFVFQRRHFPFRHIQLQYHIYVY